MVIELSPIRIGFVGCGEIVRTRHLPVLKSVQGCQVTALSDIDPSRLDQFRKLYPQYECFGDPSTLINSPTVDLVAVCSPPKSHSKVAMEAIQAGKHVFVEKPLALSLDDCDAILETADQSKSQILTGYNLRWHIITTKVRQLLRSGELGEIIAVRTLFTTHLRRAFFNNWRRAPNQGGDLIYDLATHHFDLLIHLFCSEFVSIFANYESTDQYAESVMIQATLANGVAVASQIVSGTVDQNRIELIGTQGCLNVDFYRFDGLQFYPIGVRPGSLGFRVQHSLHTLRKFPRAILRLRLGGDYHLSYRLMWQGFVDAIAKNQTIGTSLRESCEVTRIALAAIESAQTIRNVSVQSAPRKIPEVARWVERETRSSDETPWISAIVVVPETIESVRKTLSKLSGQTIADKMEIVLIVPSRSALDKPDIGLAKFFNITIVEVGAITTIARAYAAGIRRASASLVVFTEDHSFPEPDWAEAFVDAHKLPWAAVGPNMINANPGSSVSWADFYLAYSEWVGHSAAHPVRHLPGHNSCYKRNVLIAYGEQLDRMLEAESVLHWDLGQRGYALLLEPAAKTHHLNFDSWSIWIPVQFYAGRIFASSRSAGWSWGKRVIYSLASPLIPLVRLRRIYSHIRRSHPWGHFWLLLPTLLGGLMIDGLGQLVGYTLGPINAVREVNSIEFNRVRYIRNPPDDA